MIFPLNPLFQEIKITKQNYSTKKYSKKITQQKITQEKTTQKKKLLNKTKDVQDTNEFDVIMYFYLLILLHLHKLIMLYVLNTDTFGNFRYNRI